jgi:large subunit ribosomal protein L1
LKINLAALMDAVNKAKPTGTKGIYIKKLSVSSSMGVGIRIDQANIVS